MSIYADPIFIKAEVARRLEVIDDLSRQAQPTPSPRRGHRWAGRHARLSSVLRHRPRHVPG